MNIMALAAAVTTYFVLTMLALWWAARHTQHTYSIANSLAPGGPAEGDPRGAPSAGKPLGQPHQDTVTLVQNGRLQRHRKLMKTGGQKWPACAVSKRMAFD
jgi:hypothetical protein